jgi:hypothetical protein
MPTPHVAKADGLNFDRRHEHLAIWKTAATIDPRAQTRAVERGAAGLVPARLILTATFWNPGFPDRPVTAMTAEQVDRSSRTLLRSNAPATPSAENENIPVITSPAAKRGVVDRGAVQTDPENFGPA